MFQHPGEPSLDGWQLERFAKIVDHAEVDHPHDRGTLDRGRDGHDGQLREGRVSSKFREDLNSIGRGHRDVEEQQVGCLLPTRFERLRTVDRHPNHGTEAPFQHPAEQQPRSRIVVGNQNPRP